MNGEKAIPGVPASDRTVLVVDDEEENLGVVDFLLRREGFKTLAANSGARALSLLGQHPSAIVLDLVMPGSADGFAVLEEVEKLPFATTVVVITGYPSESDLARAKKHACVKAVLGKPLRQHELLAALHKSLGTVPVTPKPGRSKH